MRALAVMTGVVLLLTGCATDPEPAAPAPAAEPPSPSSVSSPPSVPSPGSTPEPVLGVDLSHHQGEVDWPRVAGAGMRFAYLKATEGSTYTDPRFAANVDGARAAGLRVGGYHYFNLCAPGAPQGEHLVAVLARELGDVPPRRRLPPAVDLELLGSCADLPARGDLVREVEAFLAVVEAATGQRAVVYAFPAFEARYRMSAAVERRQWVRRLGDRPPRRAWWLWQKDDAAVVPGIDGPADVNQLATSG